MCVQLWNTLALVPDVAERHSAQLVPLFLSFLTDEYVFIILLRTCSFHFVCCVFCLFNFMRTFRYRLDAIAPESAITSPADQEEDEQNENEDEDGEAGQEEKEQEKETEGKTSP